MSVQEEQQPQARDMNDHAVALTNSCLGVRVPLRTGVGPASTRRGAFKAMIEARYAHLAR
jgi:hypothetical protein